MALRGTYRQRHPENSAFFQCLESYWPEFRETYPYFFEKEYGPLRPVVEKTVERFLDCGIYHNGFARVRCTTCRHEYLLAFSCKTRYFCPSCQSKRVAAFVEWVTTAILEPVDHRQMVWTIPKVLRPTFRRERHLLGELVRCAWKTLQDYIQSQFETETACGAVFAIQTWGDQLNFHPHNHSLVSDVAWDRAGNALAIEWSDSSVLTRLFQHHVLEMLIREHRLSPEFAHKLRLWHHSGFQVWVGRPVPPEDQKSLERLCAYILRPSFASTRLHYDSDQGQIEYETKKGVQRSMDALDWIALVTSHIPNPQQQTVRYYGRYSNASRGKRRKQALGFSAIHSVESSGQDSPCERFAHQRRRNWARLLQKIYEVDPLTCPCGGQMEIIAFIEQPAAIRKILQHLKLWDRPQRSPPRRLFPHKLENFLETLSPRQAQQIKASTDTLFWEDVPIFEG